MSEVVSDKPFSAPAKAARAQEEKQWMDLLHTGRIVLDSVEALRKKFPGAQPEFDLRESIDYAWRNIPDFYHGRKVIDRLVRYAVLGMTKKYVAYGCLECSKIIIGMPDITHWVKDEHRPGSLEFACTNCGEVIYKVEF